MKAVVKAKAEPGLWLEDVPVPKVGGDDVLIRVLKASICGTDLHIYNWDAWAQKTIPVPMTIGHEFVGVVDAVGDHVKGFARGDLVVGEGHITCGHCRNCLAGRRHLCPNTLGVGVNRPGAWAEFVAIPQENCWHADPSIPLDVLSCFDPLGNAVHTALSFDLVGEDVLITGAGPIGCMAIPICKRAGARHVVITDVNAYRLDLARTMGADLALDVRTEKVADAMRHDGLEPAHATTADDGSNVWQVLVCGRPRIWDGRCRGDGTGQGGSRDVSRRCGDCRMARRVRRLVASGPERRLGPDISDAQHGGVPQMASGIGLAAWSAIAKFHELASASASHPVANQ